MAPQIDILNLICHGKRTIAIEETENQTHMNLIISEFEFFVLRESMIQLVEVVDTGTKIFFIQYSGRISLEGLKSWFVTPNTDSLLFQNLQQDNLICDLGHSNLSIFYPFISDTDCSTDSRDPVLFAQILNFEEVLLKLRRLLLPN